MRALFFDFPVATLAQADFGSVIMSTKRKAPNYDKLRSLGKESHVAQSGLSKLIRSIKKDGMPEASSRATQDRARKDLCGTETRYGPLINYIEVPMPGKTPITMGFQNPFAFLDHVCEHPENYAKIMQDGLRRHPCTPSNPWTIVLYQDGVDPGDGLAKNKSRHSIVFYWSFAEFGLEALSHEEVWGTVCIVRTTVAKKFGGGVAELTCRVLEQFHGDTHDILRAGVSVPLNGD